ncbi:hypothetical protein Hamer_G023358, partial [Homarus americanus]
HPEILSPSVAGHCRWSLALGTVAGHWLWALSLVTGAGHCRWALSLGTVAGHCRWALALVTGAGIEGVTKVIYRLGGGLMVTFSDEGQAKRVPIQVEVNPCDTVAWGVTLRTAVSVDAIHPSLSVSLLSFSLSLVSSVKRPGCARTTTTVTTPQLNPEVSSAGDPSERHELHVTFDLTAPTCARSTLAAASPSVRAVSLSAASP